MWMGARREFARGQPGFGRCGRELAESSLEVGRGSNDVVGSSLRVLQRFTEKFVGSSLIGCQELAGRMLGVHWVFVEGDREFVGGSLEGCREFTER
ncbi:hypothetical protein B296_00019297 [Ensete ventricosum]|uniref:Uncharacterized protein n=1 Tax=Ensete ventricosum TaxID=4639 RepID=A0A426Z8U6_ENSVE|nr:hypothetical protein B296_00019297 [Ensete ventricosum]